MYHRRIGPLLAALVVLGAHAAYAQVGGGALLEVAPDGRSFVYRMRPGDTPLGVAHAFQVPEASIPAWLASHGVGDGTRVPPGFAWHIENPLAARMDALATQVTDLTTARDAAAARADAAERDLSTARAAADRELEAARATLAGDAERRARLAAVARRWAAAQAALLVLGVALVAGVVVAVRAHREGGRAVRRARALLDELEEKRRTGLLERQQTAKHIVELEERLRRAEAAATARVRALGRPA